MFKRPEQLPKRKMVKLSKSQIRQIANRYNCNIEFVNDNKIVKISTRFQILRNPNWIAIPQYNGIVLRHQNDRGELHKTHIHNCYLDWEYLFKSIYSHDKFKNKRKGIMKPSLARAFEQIAVN